MMPLSAKASSGKYNSCWNWTLVPHHRRQQFIHYQGFLRCADCGQNMIRRTVTKNGKKYQYYHCSTYKDGGGCTPHMINSES